MKGDVIPDQDHISRLCSYQHAPEGQVQATAFMLKPNDESLSVDWLEFFGCPTRAEEISEIQKTYALRFRRVGAKASIAVLNVGEVRDRVLRRSQDKRELEVLHDPYVPLVEGQSHSGIYNLGQNDDPMIAELIRETVQEVLSACT